MDSSSILEFGMGQLSNGQSDSRQQRPPNLHQFRETTEPSASKACLDPFRLSRDDRSMPSGYLNLSPQSEVPTMPCVHLTELYELCKKHELRISSHDAVRVVCRQCEEQEVCPSASTDGEQVLQLDRGESPKQSADVSENH